MFYSIKIKFLPLLILVFFLVLNQNLYGTTPFSPSFSYNIEAAFNLTGPVLFPKIPILSTSDRSALLNQDDGYRTLGLNKLKLDLSWKELDSVAFNLTIRPDALLLRQLTPGASTKEYDSRAGEVHKSSAALSFLDLYHLTYYISKTFGTSLGVYDVISPYYSSYISPLEFGLIAKLPQKFFGIKILFKETTFAPMVAQNQPSNGIDAELTIFEGDQDRSELIAYNSKSKDYGTSSFDPYKGLAISLSYKFEDYDRFGAMLGYIDTKRTHGKESDLMGQIFATWQKKFVEKTTKISYDSRYIKSSRTASPEQRYATLQQLSTGLSASQLFAEDLWFSVGVQAGKSENYAPTNPENIKSSSGWQIETGVIKNLTKTLEFSVFAANEYRESKIDARFAEGFSTESSAPKFSLKRYSIQIEYRN